METSSVSFNGIKGIAINLDGKKIPFKLEDNLPMVIQDYTTGLGFSLFTSHLNEDLLTSNEKIKEIVIQKIDNGSVLKVIGDGIVKVKEACGAVIEGCDRAKIAIQNCINTKLVSEFNDNVEFTAEKAKNLTFTDQTKLNEEQFGTPSGKISVDFNKAPSDFHVTGITDSEWFIEKARNIKITGSKRPER